MSNVKLVNGSSVEQNVDAIVNAANKYLAAGSGVCGAIFAKAGYDELTNACNMINTPLSDGDAVITPAFGITNAKYIIHAVGPNFAITPDAFDKLYDAYYNSLALLKEKNLHSISFPLISSGIYGGELENPVDVSVSEFLRAYGDFVRENGDYDIDVSICAFSEKEMDNAKQRFR